MRHLVDLESGIREIEEKIRRLQTENTGLIRDLCEIRAENREWKEGRTYRSRPDRSNPLMTDCNPLARLDGSRKISLSSQQSEDDQLSAPFEAMWNLICLDPAVVSGEISAETVLEQLRGRLGIPSRTNADAERKSSTLVIKDGLSKRKRVKSDDQCET
jgi:hypothetical protein